VTSTCHRPLRRHLSRPRVPQTSGRSPRPHRRPRNRRPRNRRPRTPWEPFRPWLLRALPASSCTTRPGRPVDSSAHESLLRGYNGTSVHVAPVFSGDAQQRRLVTVLLAVRPGGSDGWRAGRRRDDRRGPVCDPRRPAGSHDDGVQALERGVRCDGCRCTGDAATDRGDTTSGCCTWLRTPKTIFGRYAYGLCSTSNAIGGFAGGDAEIGIHGNDDPSLLGLAATLTSLRMSNVEMTRLAALVPLGTPVAIEPWSDHRQMCRRAASPGRRPSDDGPTARPADRSRRGSRMFP